MLVAPTQWERQAVLRALPGAVPESGWGVLVWRAADLLIVESGMGPEPIGALLPRLEQLAPRSVWLFGCCGALTPELGAGDLVLARATVFSGDAGNHLGIPHAPSETVVAQMRQLAQKVGARLVVGPVLTADHVLTTEGEKRAGAVGGAVAVEMEAGPLARWTTARGLPFLHLRVVLDPMVSSLPDLLPVDAQGKISQINVALHVLGRPRQWPALWQLVRQTRRTSRRMTEVMAGLAALYAA